MATLTRTQSGDITGTGALALRIGLAVGLASLSGIMLLLAFPPYGVWPLIWIAFIPALVAQHRLLPERWARLAPAIYHGVWLTPFLMRLFGPEAPFFLRYLGLLVAVIALLTHPERKFHERTGYRWFVLQGAVDWVGFEMVRSFIPVLGTAGFVANTMATQPWLIQPVSTFSIYGLNMLVMLFNYTLAQGALALFDRRWGQDDIAAVDPRSARRWLAGVALALAAWVGGSVLTLNGAPQDAPTVRVAALQPNTPIPGQFVDEAGQVDRLQVLTGLAHEAAAQGAQIMVGPELGFGFDPQVEHSEAFRTLAEETGAYIFIGYGVDAGQGWRNEVVLLTPDGQFEDVYGKNHVFPGEPRIITSGVYPVYETPFGRLATIICHDSNFTDAARRVARNGAQLVAVPTLEWSGWAEQSFTHVVFRAVENRVAIVKTDVAYSSAIIDPYGRIVDLAITTQGEQLVLTGDVPLGTGRTLTTRLGDWMGWLALAGVVAFTAAISISERRSKRA